MSDRPIIFSAPMVRALLGGRMTQTRRILNPQPHREGPSWRWHGGAWSAGSPTLVPGHSMYERAPAKPGDRLWVRETWAVGSIYDGMSPRQFNPDNVPLYCGVRYAATDERVGIKDRASTQMPRWASRLTLDVTDVREQRLQDISEEDAVAEGCEPYAFPGPWWQGYRRDEDGELDYQQAVGDAPPDWMIEPHRMRSTPHLDRSAAEDFRSRFGTDEWAENPWVAALTFTVRHSNIDAPSPTPQVRRGGDRAGVDR